jgi:hypothetical protein
MQQHATRQMQPCRPGRNGGTAAPGRSVTGAAFRDRGRGVPVIGKVLRGTNAARLLYYLYGPGKANEHADPHLVAGFGDLAELEPERRPGGSRDFRRPAGLLAQPLAALYGPGYDSRCGTAPCAPPQVTGSFPTRNGPRPPRRSCTAPGLAPRDDDAGRSRACSAWWAYPAFSGTLLIKIG